MRLCSLERRERKHTQQCLLPLSCQSADRASDSIPDSASFCYPSTLTRFSITGCILTCQSTLCSALTPVIPIAARAAIQWVASRGCKACSGVSENESYPQLESILTHRHKGEQAVTRGISLRQAVSSVLGAPCQLLESPRLEKHSKITWSNHR